MSAKCPKCGGPFTATDQMLSAIYGTGNICSKCYEEKLSPKCEICGKVTQLSINGHARCAKHMEV